MTGTYWTKFGSGDTIADLLLAARTNRLSEADVEGKQLFFVFARLMTSTTRTAVKLTGKPLNVTDVKRIRGALSHMMATSGVTA